MPRLITDPVFNAVRKSIAGRDDWGHGGNSNDSWKYRYSSSKIPVKGVLKNKFHLALYYNLSSFDVKNGHVEVDLDEVKKFITSYFPKINEFTSDFLEIALDKCLRSENFSSTISVDDFEFKEKQFKTKQAISEAFMHLLRFSVEFISMPFMEGKSIVTKGISSPLIVFNHYGYKTNHSKKTSQYYWSISLGDALKEYLISMNSAGRKYNIPYIPFNRSILHLNHQKCANEKNMAKSILNDFRRNSKHFNKPKCNIKRKILTLMNEASISFGKKVTPFQKKSKFEDYLETLVSLDILKEWTYIENSWNDIESFKRGYFSKWLESSIYLVPSNKVEKDLLGIKGSPETKSKNNTETPKSTLEPQKSDLSLDQIKTKLKSKSIKQIDLASLLGVSKGYISQILSGKKPMSSLLKKNLMELLNESPL